MATTNIKPVLAADIILRKDGEVLLGRRANVAYGSGEYWLPGGHIEPKESITAAVIRESREELGINITEADLNLVNVLYHLTNRANLNLIFDCWKWQGEPRIMEPDKCDDLQWFPLDELPGNTAPHIIHVIQNYQAGQLLTHHDAKHVTK